MNKSSENKIWEIPIKNLNTNNFDKRICGIKRGYKGKIKNIDELKNHKYVGNKLKLKLEKSNNKTKLNKDYYHIIEKPDLKNFLKKFDLYDSEYIFKHSSLSKACESLATGKKLINVNQLGNEIKLPKNEIKPGSEYIINKNHINLFENTDLDIITDESNDSIKINKYCSNENVDKNLKINYKDLIKLARIYNVSIKGRNIDICNRLYKKGLNFNSPLINNDDEIETEKISKCYQLKSSECNNYDNCIYINETKNDLIERLLLLDLLENNHTDIDYFKLTKEQLSSKIYDYWNKYLEKNPNISHTYKVRSKGYNRCIKKINKQLLEENKLNIKKLNTELLKLTKTQLNNVLKEIKKQKLLKTNENALFDNYNLLFKKNNNIITNNILLIINSIIKNIKIPNTSNTKQVDILTNIEENIESILDNTTKDSQNPLETDASLDLNQTIENSASIALDDTTKSSQNPLETDTSLDLNQTIENSASIALDDTGNITQDSEEPIGSSIPLDDTDNITQDSEEPIGSSTPLEEDTGNITEDSEEPIESSASLEEDIGNITEDSEEPIGSSIPLEEDTGNITEDSEEPIGSSIPLEEDTGNIIEDSEEAIESSDPLEENMKETSGNSGLLEDMEDLIKNESSLDISKLKIPENIETDTFNKIIETDELSKTSDSEESSLLDELDIYNIKKRDLVSKYEEKNNNIKLVY